MRTATLRELRNDFAKLEALLAEGESIQICRRGKPVAVLSPPHGAGDGELPPLPDFEARRKEIWGERFFTQEEIARMEAYEQEGQEG